MFHGRGLEAERTRGLWVVSQYVLFMKGASKGCHIFGCPQLSYLPQFLARHLKQPGRLGVLGDHPLFCTFCFVM